MTPRTHAYQNDIYSPIVDEFCDNPRCELPHKGDKLPVTPTKSVAELDSQLLASALRSMIVRYIRLAEECGYDEPFIRATTETELALVNRIEIGMSK